MATLRTTINYHSGGYGCLELAPNSPSKPELIDTYCVRLWIHDQLIYDQIHSVRNWQMRHFYVEEIARAFCCIQELLGKEIACQADNASNHDKSFLSFVHAVLSTDWLTVTLAAPHRKRKGDLVHVTVQLQKAEYTIGDVEHSSRGQWGKWEEMIVARIFCTPKEAIAFGLQLRREIDQVEEERRALGIPECDDEDKYKA